MVRKTALVIGASKGSIGDAIAKEFLHRGCRVFATARSIEKVEHLQHVGIEVLALDVTSSESIDGAAMTITQLTGGSLDFLTNSAGLGRQTFDRQLASQIEYNY
jgi:NAD(P)-dependent dehydrogenase (short-subunit alcohol dehydrogenase family)